MVFPPRVIILLGLDWKSSINNSISIDLKFLASFNSFRDEKKRRRKNGIERFGETRKCLNFVNKFHAIVVGPG